MAVPIPVDHGLLPKSAHKGASSLRKIGHRVRHSAWRWVYLPCNVRGLLLTVSNTARSLLASQYAARMNKRCDAGVILLGVTAGCHLNNYMARTAQYHPDNEFGTGDPIGRCIHQIHKSASSSFLDLVRLIG